MSKRGFEKFAASKSKIFLTVCLAFICGIAIESFAQINAEQWIFLSVISIGLGAVTIFWKNIKARLVFFTAVFFVLGFWCFESSLPDFSEDKIQSYYNQDAFWQGVIVGEPDRRQDKIKYTVEVNEIEGVGPVSGRMLVSMALFPEFSYGDRISVQCKIQKPEPISDFRYDRYLAKDGIFSLCYPYHGARLVEPGQANQALSLIYFVKDKFAEKTAQIFPEPQASFLGGLLYGARSGLPQDVLDNFQATGVTHIIAISGYNITIVSAIFLIFAYSIGISRKKAFPWIVIAIAVFVIFTGASASVTRAGIMGVLVLLAKQTGRSSQIFNTLVFTAAIMSLQNPWVIIFDAGFQLSFLATVGLVYLAPMIGPWFSRVPKIFGLQESIVSTLSAIAMTTPLILFQFGRFSLIAPFANILILSAIPLTMMLGFAVVIIGFVSISLGQIFSWLPWLVLTYMLKITEILSRIEFTQFEIPNFHWLILLAMYLWLCIYIYLGQRRIKSGTIKL
ncbi:MAG: ComEC/Rec2 family competence protein [bacterium]